MNKPILGFIGMGKVGQTLSAVWHAQGYVIGSIYSRHTAILPDIAHHLNASIAHQPVDVVSASDIVFLTVSDDAIEAVANGLAEANWEHKACVHCSGSRSIASLVHLQRQGAMVGSLHPAFPFADVATAKTAIYGATFAVEASDVVLEHHLHDLVDVLHGTVLSVTAESKALYHAALCIASNYMVTLYGIAEDLLLKIGASKDSADNALNHLVQGATQNLLAKGVPMALTGPLVRQDLETIQSHLSALHTSPYRDMYRQLARLTYPILQARGVAIEEIDILLRKDEQHAPNNT